MDTTPLERAIEISGGQAALARAIGTKQQNVFVWKEKNKVPAEFVAKIEEATGISKHELRPDIFGTQSEDA